MIAPMGMGAAQIKGNEAGVTLKMADGREQFSDDPDELFATMTDLELPVSGLRDWIRGMPMHDVAFNDPVWNEYNQLHKLRQMGWRVEMSKYRKVKEFELPHAFYLEREEGPELSVRLLVRRWQPQPAQ
jgi:outer membrane lipoprotein LolB